MTALEIFKHASMNESEGEMNMEKCKNCGHDIEKIQKNWYHFNSANGWGFSNHCPYTLDNEKTKSWKQNKLNELTEQVSKEFKGYTRGFSSINIICACAEPEPIVETNKRQEKREE